MKQSRSRQLKSANLLLTGLLILFPFLLYYFHLLDPAKRSIAPEEMEQVLTLCRQGATFARKQTRREVLKGLNAYHEAYERVRDNQQARRSIRNPMIELYDLLQHEHAHAFFVEALAICQAEGDREQEILVLTCLARLMNTHGKNMQALRYQEQALSLDTDPVNQAAHAIRLAHLANLEMVPGHREKAAASLAKALASADRAEDQTAYAEVYYLQGLILNRRGRYRLMIRSLEKARSVVDRKASPVLYANIELGLACAYRYLGEPFRALAHLAKAAGPLERMERSEVGTLLYNQGLIHASLGERYKARETLERAREAYHRRQSFNGEASVIWALGTLFLKSGDVTRALDHFKDALIFFRRHENLNGQGILLNAIGLAYHRHENPKLAQPYHEEALALFRSSGLRSRVAEALQALARFHHDFGDPREAACLYREALDIERELGVLHPQAVTLRSLGELMLGEGDIDRSVELVERALSLFQKTRDPQAEALTLNVLASIAEVRGELDQAIEINGRALNIVDSLRARIMSPHLSTYYSGEIYSLFADQARLYLARHHQFPEGGDDRRALECIERGRSRALFESMKRIPNLGTSEEEQNLSKQRHTLIHQFNARLNARLRLRSGGSMQRQVELDNEIKDLMHEIDLVESRVRASRPNFDSETTLDLASLMRQLDEETTLLVFFLDTPKSVLWKIDRTHIETIALPDKREIEARTIRLIELAKARNRRVRFESLPERERRLATADDALHEISYALSKALFPHREILTGRRLVVVADGLLANLPFALLPNPGSHATRSLLLDDHELVWAPSLPILHALLKRPSREIGNNLTVFADPVFSQTDDRLGKMRSQTRSWFHDLPISQNPVKAPGLLRSGYDIGVVHRSIPDSSPPGSDQGLVWWGPGMSGPLSHPLQDCQQNTSADGSELIGNHDVTAFALTFIFGGAYRPDPWSATTVSGIIGNSQRNVDATPVICIIGRHDRAVKRAAVGRIVVVIEIDDIPTILRDGTVRIVAVASIGIVPYRGDAIRGGNGARADGRLVGCGDLDRDTGLGPEGHRITAECANTGTVGAGGIGLYPGGGHPARGTSVAGNKEITIDTLLATGGERDRQGVRP